MHPELGFDRRPSDGAGPAGVLEGIDSPEVRLRYRNFTKRVPPAALQRLGVSEQDLRGYVTTGVEPPSIQAARQRMQAARTSIVDEIKFFQSALPLFSAAASVRAEADPAQAQAINDQALGANALSEKIASYEQKAYRLWIDSTKGNISRLRRMAGDAISRAKAFEAEGRYDEANALFDQAMGWEDEALRQSKLITGALLVRKVARAEKIYVDGDDASQYQRTKHTEASDEIADLLTDQGEIEAARTTEAVDGGAEDPPQALPRPLIDARLILDEADALDPQADRDAGHLSTKGRVAGARNLVAGTFLQLNGYPPGSEHDELKVTDGMIKMFGDQVSDMLDEAHLVSAQLELLDRVDKPIPAADERRDALLTRQMELSIQIETTKQRMIADRKRAGLLLEDGQTLHANLEAASTELSALRDELAAHLDLGKIAREEGGQHLADWTRKLDALTDGIDGAKTKEDQANRALSDREDPRRKRNADGLGAMAMAGAAPMIEDYQANRPADPFAPPLPGVPGAVGVDAVLDAYDLEANGPSTQEVLLRGEQAANRLGRPDLSTLEGATRKARGAAFDESAATAWFFGQVTRLYRRGGEPNPDSIRASGQAEARMADVQAQLDAAPAAEKPRMAGVAVHTGVAVAVATSVEDPQTARGLLEDADRNVGEMNEAGQSDGHVIVADGAVAHSEAIAGRQPPLDINGEPDDAYDRAVELGDKMLGDDRAPQIDAAIVDKVERHERLEPAEAQAYFRWTSRKDGWDSANERLEHVESLPEQRLAMIEARIEAAGQAEEIAAARAIWATREGRLIASGAISYLADGLFLVHGGVRPSEMLEQGAANVRNERVGAIERSTDKEVEALNGLAELVERAGANGRFGELMGRLSIDYSVEPELEHLAEEVGYSGKPPLFEIVKLLYTDQTPLAGAMRGEHATLESAAAMRALVGWTAPTNQDAAAGVGMAEAHLAELRRSGFFAYVGLPIAIGEAIVETIMTAGLAAELSAAKLGTKLLLALDRGAKTARMIKRANDLRRAARATQAGAKLLQAGRSVKTAHQALSRGSRLYVFSSKVLQGLVLNHAQKGIIGLSRGMFAQGSFGEKALAGAVGAVGDFGAARVYGLVEHGKKLIVPVLQAVANQGFVVYMQRDEGWTAADAKNAQLVVELTSVLGGAAHGALTGPRQASKRSYLDAAQRFSDHLPRPLSGAQVRKLGEALRRLSSTEHETPAAARAHWAKIEKTFAGALPKAAQVALRLEAAASFAANRQPRLDPLAPPDAAAVKAGYDALVADMKAAQPDLHVQLVHQRAQAMMSQHLEALKVTGEAQPTKREAEVNAHATEMQEVLGLHAAREVALGQTTVGTAVDGPAGRAALRPVVDAAFEAVNKPSGGNRATLEQHAGDAVGRLKKQLVDGGMDPERASKTARQTVIRTLDNVAFQTSYAKVVLASAGAVPAPALRATYEQSLKDAGFSAAESAARATQRYAQHTAAELAGGAGLTPAQQARAVPELRQIIELHQSNLDAGGQASFGDVRVAVEARLGQLAKADGTPLLTGSQIAALAKIASIDLVSTHALATATGSASSFELQTPQQLQALVIAQSEGLRAAGAGRVPPLFSEADIAGARSAVIEGFIAETAHAKGTKIANERGAPLTDRARVELVRAEAGRLKAHFPDLDADRIGAQIAINIAVGQMGETASGAKLLTDPASAARAQSEIIERTRRLGVDAEATKAALDSRGRTMEHARATDELSGAGPMIVKQRVLGPDGQPKVRDGVWQLEELHGYQLIDVDREAATALVRGPDGRVRSVALDAVVFDHQGMRLGVTLPIDQRAFNARYADLQAAGLAGEWRALMGRAAAISPEHAELLKRTLIAPRPPGSEPGDPLSHVRQMFERIKGVPQAELGQHFSMTGHTQHYKDACPVAATCHAVGSKSPQMARVLTGLKETTAIFQGRMVAVNGGASSPRRQATDPAYRGGGGLGPNQHIPAAAGTADARARAAVDPALAATHDNFAASHLDPAHFGGQVASMLSRGHDVVLTLRSPGSDRDVAVRLTGPHGPANRRYFAVQPPAVVGPSAYIRSRAGALYLGDLPISSAVAPAGRTLRGRRGFNVTDSPQLMNDLKLATYGAEYRRQGVDGTNRAATLDRVERLAAQGYPVILEVAWDTGGAHAIVVLPGQRTRLVDGQTELLVYDPWNDRAIWLDRAGLEVYRLGAGTGSVRALIGPADGSGSGPAAFADTIPAGGKRAVPELSAVSRSGVKRAAVQLSRRGAKRVQQELPKLAAERDRTLETLDRLASDPRWTQQTRARIRRAINAVTKNAKPEEMTGALRDMLHIPVRRSGDGYTFDHLAELSNAMRSLTRAQDALGAELNRLRQDQHEIEGLSKDLDQLADFDRRIRAFLEIR